MLGKIKEPKLVCDVLDAKFNSLLVLLVNFEHLDQQINISALLLLRHLFKWREKRNMDLHIVRQVSDRPFSQSF